MELKANVFGKNGPVQTLPCPKNNISTSSCRFIARFSSCRILISLNFGFINYLNGDLPQFKKFQDNDRIFSSLKYSF